MIRGVASFQGTDLFIILSRIIVYNIVLEVA